MYFLVKSRSELFELLLSDTIYDIFVILKNGSLPEVFMVDDKFPNLGKKN
jgi:hypothetical protein